MRARRQNRAGHRLAEAFQHRLFARVHKHDAGGQQQHRELREQQQEQVFFSNWKNHVSETLKPN